MFRTKCCQNAAQQKEWQSGARERVSMGWQVDALKVEQHAKCQHNRGGWKCQMPQASQRLLPIRRHEKHQTDLLADLQQKGLNCKALLQ